VLIAVGERDSGMGRDANSARDLLAAVEIGEEVLAEALASHGWKCSKRRAKRAES